MRRIKFTKISGTGPKRAQPLEKPSQRIARQARALVLRKLTGLPKEPCPRCPPYRLICDKCALADPVDKFTIWAKSKFFVEGQPLASRQALAANSARLRALIKGAARPGQLPRASE